MIPLFFIVLTLAGYLGGCLNTHPNGLIFKQLANVNVLKAFIDPYIFLCEIILFVKAKSV